MTLLNIGQVAKQKCSGRGDLSECPILEELDER
jgi:hypothetical protein